MHPIIFKYQVPEFLQSFLGVEFLTLYSYAFFIVLGTVLATLYAKYNSKKQGLEELPNTFFYSIFIAGFVGGKIFTWLENPKIYVENPELLFNIFSGGFVFYGSLILAIPVAIWFLKSKNYVISTVLDIMAISTVIAHFFGRIGCFFAGCCYGKPTHHFFGVAFPLTNGDKVIPTQLIEAFLLLMIGGFLLKLKCNSYYKGKIFLVYLTLYAVIRFFLEFLRGDFRGTIFQFLSHSQFISILFIVVSIVLLNNKKLNTNFKFKKMKTKILTNFIPLMFILTAVGIIGSGCPAPNNPPSNCITTSSDFQTLYGNLITAGNLNKVTYDSEVHSYTFEVLSNKTICKIGYQSQPAIASTPYKIEIFDNTSNQLVYSGSHVFSSTATSYVIPTSTVNLYTGKSYTIRRIQTNWGSNIANTIGRLVTNSSMSNLGFPFTQGNLKITGSSFYQNAGTWNNGGIPYIDIIFQ